MQNAERRKNLMMFDLLIRNGNIVTSEGVTPGSIGVNAGKIVEIGDVAGSAKEEIDAFGLHIFPGLIDPHVHFNEPGRTDWEGFGTGSSALAAGGGTCFFDMPLNSSPPTLDGTSFDLKRAAAEASSRTDFALWGGLTPNNLDKMEQLADRGVIGFKAFMSSSGIADFERADDQTLRTGMEIAARLGLIVAVHAESEEITSGLTQEIRAKNTTADWDDYLASRPIQAEVEAIERAIKMASEAGCALHIVHVSSSDGAHAVKRAADAGIANVTCETCPHYLAMTIYDLEGLGARAKCAPPLRSPLEVAKLWEDVEDELFAFIGSDHSPAPESMKTGVDPFSIWGGIAGVQSTLPILLSRAGVPLPLVAKLLSKGAADRFGIKGKGSISIGFDADLAIVDLSDSFELTTEMLLDRHKLSPYVGRTFRGVVKRTIVRGETVVRDGQPVGQFRGRLIAGARHG
jgi:allantoinase